MSLRHLLPLLVVCAACGPEDGKTSSDSSSGATDSASSEPTGSSDPTSSTSSTAATDSGSSTAELPTTSDGSSTGEPPDFVRECQPGDFICEDWGCERGDVVELSECYKPCTPSVIGEPDDECDEPERPFCSQVGQAFGGDFDCNGCAHICVSDSFNQCNQSVASCV